MHWVIQNNIFRETAVERLFEVLARLDLPHTVVRVVPFDGRIEPDVEIEGPVVVVGSVSLVRHALARGWKPGGWAEEEPFGFARCLAEFGGEMLNADAVQCRFGDVASLGMEEFFIRPHDDGKLFAGTVMEATQFGEWSAKIADADSTWTITPDTRVVVAPPKVIQTETRFVVVDGRIVTGSIYRKGARTVYDADVSPEVLAWARERASRWTPADVCVLDVAETPNGMRIVEWGNINSAGWYACDVEKIVTAIEDRFAEPEMGTTP